MRTFLTLMDKEWRDVRGLVWASCALVVAVTVALNHWALHWDDGPSTALVVPACVALFVAVIAADLVAQERLTGRAGTFAALPASLRRLWLAKVTFLSAATLVFTAWTLLVQLLLYGALAPVEELSAVFEHMDRAGLVALQIAPLGCAVLFFSTLLPRGFAAALAGLLVVLAAWWALYQADWVAYELTRSTFSMQLGVGALGILLLGGSYLSFTRGPVHAGSSLRRVALAVAVPLGVLVPAGTAGAIALDHRLSLDPGDPFVGAMYASPDGRFLAVNASKPRQRRQHVWIVPTDGGPVHALQGRYLSVDHEAWQKDGSLHLWTLRPVVRNGRFVTLVQEARHIVEPATGAIRSTRSIEQIHATEEQRPRPSLTYGTVRRWWRLALGSRMRDADLPCSKHVQWGAGGLDAHVRSVSTIFMSPQPGCVIFSPEQGTLVHRDLRTGEDLLRVATGRSAVGMMSADGNYLHVHEVLAGNRLVTRILDAHTGAHVAGPFGEVSESDSARAGYRPEHLGYPESDWVFLRDHVKSRSKLLNLATGAEVPWPYEYAWLPPPSTHVPHLGTAIARDGRIDVLDAHGNVIRTLLD